MEKTEPTNEGDILLEAAQKRQTRGRRTKGCSNGILNCLRASARTFTELNKRIDFSQDVVFCKDQTLKLDDKEAFTNVLKKFPWISYRSDFKEINGFTSDSGWGCMIRTGQMMIAYTLVQIKLEEYKTPESDSVHEKVLHAIIPMFFDNQMEFDAPFSIQNIIQIGEKMYNKAAGLWYGANSVSHCLKECHDRYNTKFNSDLEIKIFNEGIVYEDEITKVLEENKRLLVIIPQRLGLKKVDPAYFPQIKELLGCKLSMGILGGRDTSARFIIGHQEDTLITLDPHYDQCTVDTLDEGGLATYVTEYSRNFSIYDLDTTVAFCFLISSTMDKEFLNAKISTMKVKYKDDNILIMLESKKTLEDNIHNDIESF
ncbi:unnamed protein product [Moneuplotes crassus]|uniref:Cysteine protease n=1 Tax=Euplotes crassus TaxID=5936 RepID=A0AAD1UI73_EUPCR|nr:unnamed protein product [Moneuplotes crassus]